MNFQVRPPAIVEGNDWIPLNQRLTPLGFRLLALNSRVLTVVGEGFRQEAIRTVYSYFSAKRKSGSQEGQ